MGREIPLQYELFTGALVDPRSPKERRRDQERDQLRQAEMFPQKELAQFGVRASPQIPLSPKTHLELTTLDLRTEEEKDYDRMRAAEVQTYSYLDRKSAQVPARTKVFPSGLRLPLAEMNEQELGFAVHLTEDIKLLFWSTRDEEYERLRGEIHLAGNEVYLVGNDQLEIRETGRNSCFLITYSDMGMIENIEQISGYLSAF